MMQNRKGVSVIFSFLVALIGAFVLWIYVVTTVTPETTKSIYNVPISLQGSILLEEKGLMVTTEEKSVNLELRGSRSNLNKLTQENIKVIADLSRISREGTYTLELEISFPTVTGSGGIEVVRKSVSTVEVTVTKVETKTLAVQIEWEGTAREGYYFDSSNATVTLAQEETPEIVVTGPESEIAPIVRVVVRCGDISALTETVIEEYPILLLDADDQEVTLSEFSSINETVAVVTLPILKNKELKLVANVIDGGGAKLENAELTYSVETLAVRGTGSVIDALADEFLIGEIDLAKTANGDSKVFKLTLPAGVKNVTGVTEVEVKVKLTGLSTVTIFVDAADVVLQNRPQNVTVSLTAEKIPVTLRGPAEDVAKITAEDLRVVVDLSNMTQSGERQATVSVANYPEVGTFGDVMVEIKLS